MARNIIGIVGVGLMGFGIATNIIKSGRSLAFLEHSGNQPTDTLIEKGASKFQYLAEPYSKM